MSKRGHVPIRMCIGCRKKRDKKEMVRFTEGEGGNWLVDTKKGLGGRGFYLCPEITCLKKAQKKSGMAALSTLKEVPWEMKGHA